MEHVSGGLRGLRRFGRWFSSLTMLQVWGLLGALLLAGALKAQETPGLDTALAVQNAFERAIQRAEPSVVSVMLAPPDEALALTARGVPRGNFGGVASVDPRAPNFFPLGAGSGVIVGAEGLVLTNYHVVDTSQAGAEVGPAGHAPSIRIYVVLSDRRKFEAEVFAADPRSDLAVLRLKTDPSKPITQQPIVPNLRPITFGDVSKLKKGTLALALGNPYTLARDGSASASWGIISNIARRIYPGPEEYGPMNTLQHFGTLLQTDARLNLGTSGGALINLKGEMVGLTTSLAALAGYEQAAGYALPMDAGVLQTIEVLKQGKEREYGFLGINLAPFDGMTGGVTVHEVRAGTPASWAGLQMGDLITEIAGRTITSRDELMLVVGSLSVGSPVPVRIVRDQQSKTLTVLLGKYPLNQSERPVVFSVKSPAWRGLRVDYQTATLIARGRGYDDFPVEQGVLVREVERDTPAAKAGLEPNQFITEVGGRKVRTPKDFFDAVEKLSDQRVQLKTVAGRESEVKSVDPS